MGAKRDCSTDKPGDWFSHTASLPSVRAKVLGSSTKIERSLMKVTLAAWSPVKHSANANLRFASDKYKIDPKFKINIGGWIWRRRLAKGSNGDYWDYFISNAKETK